MGDPFNLEEKTPVKRRAAMSWAQRLKRIFNLAHTLAWVLFRLMTR